MINTKLSMGTVSSKHINDKQLEKTSNATYQINGKKYKCRENFFKDLKNLELEYKMKKLEINK